MITAFNPEYRKAVEKHLKEATMTNKTEPTPLAPEVKKPRMFTGVILRFHKALAELAKVSDFGAKKYGNSAGDRTYLGVENGYEFYTAKLVAHIADELVEGPINRKDGDLLHAAQAAWNALARLEYLLERGILGVDLERQRPAGFSGGCCDPKFLQPAAPGTGFQNSTRYDR